MRWHALALFLALLPARWLGQLLASPTSDLNPGKKPLLRFEDRRKKVPSA